MAGIASALLVAACGGGSSTAGVARLGSTTTTGTTTGATGTTTGATGTTSASSASGASGSSDPGAQALKFSACMRSHGEPNFPEFGNLRQRWRRHGMRRLRVTPASGIDPGSPTFKDAQQACRAFAPVESHGSGSAPQLSAQEQAQVLQLASCIRKHGEPNLPDPTFAGGGAHLPPTVNTDSEVQGGHAGVPVADPEQPARARWRLAACVRLRAGSRSRGWPWCSSRSVVLVLVVTDPFAGPSKPGGVADNATATSLATVTRRGLSSQTPVNGTLGYADASSVASPPGTPPSAVQQVEQSVTAGEAMLRTARASLAADGETLAGQRATLSAAREKESVDCPGRARRKPRRRLLAERRRKPGGRRLAGRGQRGCVHGRRAGGVH